MPPRTQNSPCSSTGSSRVKPGVGEQIAQHDRIEIHPVLQLDGRGLETVGRAQPRQQRGGRCHDDRGGSARDRVQCRGARRGDAEMRRDIAIRIDLQRRKRLDGILERGGRRAFERGHEESRVDAESIDVLVARHDDDSTRALLRWLDWTATYSACADGDSPRTCAADESIPVRAAAVLRSAWRLSDVTVGIRRSRSARAVA